MKHLNLSALFLACFLICLLQESFSGAAVNTDDNFDNKTVVYLARYGYLVLQNGTEPSERDVKEAITLFQRCFGLLQTGEIDEETKELMNFPRCGMEDAVCLDSKKRKKRYTLKGSHWGETNLTYRITRYPQAFKESLVDNVIARAFKYWSDVSPLTFTETTTFTKVNIEIRFMTGDHGDGSPFTGLPLGAVAHAFYPSAGGSVHFDESRTWTFGSNHGINLLQAAAHEFGHAIGIDHSNIQTSLMAPYYRGYKKNMKLTDDDILAVKNLYGTKEKRAEAHPHKPVSYPWQ